MSKKKLAWSYSALDMFENCAKKFYHLKIAKTHKEPDSEWQADGKFVHDALFKYVIDGVPLPPTIRHMQGLADKVMKLPHKEKYGEMRLCLNDKFEPVDFFAPDAWVRVVVDLVLLNDDTAIIIDWKTGKKKPGFDQLKLSAAVLSRVMPEVENFYLIYAWLKVNDYTKDKIAKDELKQVWLHYLPKVKKLNEANKTTTFPATPGPLCRFCCIYDCPHFEEHDR